MRKVVSIKDQIDTDVDSVNTRLEATTNELKDLITRSKESVRNETEKRLQIVENKIDRNSTGISDLEVKLTKDLNTQVNAIIDNVKNDQKKEILNEVAAYIDKRVAADLAKNSEDMNRVIGKVNSNLTSLSSTIKDVRGQLVGYQSEVDNLSEKYNDIIRKVSSFDLKTDSISDIRETVDNLSHDVHLLRKDSSDKTEKLNSVIDLFNTSQTKFMDKLVDLERDIRKANVEFYGHQDEIRR